MSEQSTDARRNAPPEEAPVPSGLTRGPDRVEDSGEPQELRSKVDDLQQRVKDLEADAAERKRAIDRIVQHSSEVEARLQSRNEELRTVQHELDAVGKGLARNLKKTSGVVLQLARELEQNSGSLQMEQAGQVVSLIRAGTEQTSELASRLALYADIPKRPIESKTVRMAGLLVDVARSFARDIDSRHVDLKFDLHLPEVRGEEDLLRVLMKDLVGNALKFTRTVATPVIEIGMSEDETGPTWFVRDNGIGFPSKSGYKPLSPFHRFHGDEYEGFGVGLAVAQRIVKRHGGEIWVESQESVGTTVYFTLSNGSGRTNQARR